MKKLYQRIVAEFNRKERWTDYSITDEKNPYVGGSPDSNGLCESSYINGPIYYDCICYSCADFKTYRDESLLCDLIRECEYYRKHSHDDGTLDMLSSNFSTPAMFELIGLTDCYHVLEKYSRKTELEVCALDALKSLIDHLASGFLVSGFHTPNHRWVTTAALYGAYNLTGREELREKAEQYLAEGIDIDETGEFTERSVGMYNYINDWALYTVAVEGKKPELFDAVYKNLNLMLDYFEYDGSLFTMNSRRKDKGEVSVSSKWYPSNFCWLYLVFAYMKNDLRFARAAEMIFENDYSSGRGMPLSISTYLNNPDLNEWEPDTSGVSLPSEFELYQPKSNIFRVRHGKWSYSLLGNESPNFLFFRCGKTHCYMRICASFFAVAQFGVKKLEKTDSGYRMHFHTHAEYKMPYETPQKSSVWEEMDYSARKSIMPLEFYIDVELTPVDSGFDLRVVTSGCKDVPIKIETVVSSGTRMITDSFVQTAKAGGSLVLRDGTLTLDDLHGNVINISGAFASHTYAENMRGSLPQSAEDFTVYFTAQTEIDKTISVRFSRRSQPFNLLA